MASIREITDRFTKDRSIAQRIADGEVALTTQALDTLRQGFPTDWILVAYWRTAQFSTDRRYRIEKPRDLSFVLAGYLLARCTNLRFFIMAKERAPQSSSHRELFA